VGNFLACWNIHSVLPDKLIADKSLHLCEHSYCYYNIIRHQLKTLRVAPAGLIPFAVRAIIGSHIEERQTGNSENMPDLWHQSI
jgi:hypothetical protein